MLFLFIVMNNLYLIKTKGTTLLIKLAYIKVRTISYF